MTHLFLVFTVATAMGMAPPDKPTPRPGAGTMPDRAKLLIDAIRTNKPAVADPLFFQREPFRKVKGIQDPDQYFDYLIKVYHQDIQTIRESLKDPDTIEFVSFDLGRWKRWVPRGKEANARPYHAVHKSPLVIRDAGREKTIRLRVAITWDGQWYVTHLIRKRHNETPDPKLMPR